MTRQLIVNRKLDIASFGYRHARSDERWLADSSAGGLPAILSALTGASGAAVVQQRFAADPMTDEVYSGTTLGARDSCLFVAPDDYFKSDSHKRLAIM